MVYLCTKHERMKLQPPFLVKGDLIAIVSPAGKVPPGKLQAAVTMIEARGYRVWVGAHVYDAYCQFAGTDEHRAADLQAALDNPEVKAIFCARGGYGTIRIIEKVDFSTFRKNPKWIAGIS